MLTKNIHRTKLLLPHYVKQRSPLLKTDEHAAFSKAETRPDADWSQILFVAELGISRKTENYSYTLLIFFIQKPILTLFDLFLSIGSALTGSSSDLWHYIGELNSGRFSFLAHFSHIWLFVPTYLLPVAAVLCALLVAVAVGLAQLDQFEQIQQEGHLKHF